MLRQPIRIDYIPALLWGPPSDRLFIAVHGDGSHKEDDVIRILAEEAGDRGFQTLSFDLPEHGGRQGEPRPCKARECVEDLGRVMTHARALSDHISLFGCSIGACFGMMAYSGEPLERALFLSPVVDMERLIRNMMDWFSVTEEQLRQQGEIATPVKTLYWDYFRYVADHPIRWSKPTAILCGAGDTLCEPAATAAFAKRTNARLTVLEEAEHFFHTEGQLDSFRRWLRKCLEP